MADLSFTNVMAVGAIAVAAPLIAAVIPKVKVPGIVIEFVLGVVVGPDVLGWVKIDEPLDVLSLLALGFLLFILAFQVLFYPGEVSEYLWRWGILSVSTEGLRAAGILGLRVIFLYYVTTMLMLTTSLVDLTNGLELIFGPLQRLRVPVNELVLVFVIAIKFVPIFIEEVERLARAQTARGVPFDEGGALTRARRIGRLLVPIFISGFARADTLTIAMNTRSYRGGRYRTKFRQMRASLSDWLALMLVTLWVIGAWIV